MYIIMKTVVCKNAQNQTQLNVNMIYDVDIIAQCKCGVIAYGLKGIDNYAKGKDPKLKSLCRCGMKFTFDKPMFASDRFNDVTVHEV